MLASSAFVLAALTMTGIYMRSQDTEPENDGYSLDLAQMEDNAEDKANEIAQNAGEGEETAQGNGGTVAQNDDKITDADVSGDAVAQGKNMDDALDFMPLEAEADLVIPSLTDGEEVADGENMTQEHTVAQVNSGTVTNSLQFAESDGLLRPVNGEVLIPFSMDGSIYFSTLDQYKYNPAVIISAKEDSVVASCAEGRVVRVYESPETGGTVIVDLGGGYEITYSQLKNVAVATGDYVGAGYLIGHVAKPTKYYTVEGSNLYLKMTKDGEPIDAAALFR